MCKNHETQDWLARADEVCIRLTENLQVRCTAARTFDYEPDLLPFWCDSLKEALLYRSTELAGTAIDLYRRNFLVSAVIITRSLLETAALFNRLYETCSKVVKKHEKGKCSDDIIKELLRKVQKISVASTETRDNATRSNIKPFGAPALVKDLDTRHNARGSIISTYEGLCQMVHPNFKGCLDAFTNWNAEKKYVEFIQDYRHVQEDAHSYIMFLFLVLDIVENLEGEMAELLPKFAKACEEYIERQHGKGDKKYKGQTRDSHL